MYINANINGFNTPIELPEIFAEREQIQVSGDSYVIKQGSLVEIGGVLTINTVAPNKGTGTEGSKHVDLTPYHLVKVLNVQVTAEDTPAGSIHENAHIGDVSNDGFVVYATSTYTAPVEFKVRYLVRAIA